MGGGWYWHAGWRLDFGWVGVERSYGNNEQRLKKKDRDGRGFAVDANDGLEKKGIWGGGTQLGYKEELTAPKKKKIKGIAPHSWKRRRRGRGRGRRRRQP